MKEIAQFKETIKNKKKKTQGLQVNGCIESGYCLLNMYAILSLMSSEQHRTAYTLLKS